MNFFDNSVLHSFADASNIEFIPIKGSSCNNTNSNSTQQDCVIQSRKRRREQSSEKQCIQTETFYQSNSQAIDPQSGSLPNEQQTNQGNQGTILTCSSDLNKKKSRKE